MEKIQMPCTEEQFNRDLKPFLVDAGVDLKILNTFESKYFLEMPFGGKIKISTYFEQEKYKTIDYNPKEFLKHLGIEIYEVGDVVKIGECECYIISRNYGYYLTTGFGNSSDIISQFEIMKLKSFPEHTTLYDINKTIQFLKSHENKMQEKPFTIEQAQQMLAIESLKELAYQYYPELKNPVNLIDEKTLEDLSFFMFGKRSRIVAAKASTRIINRPDLDGKAFLVRNCLKPVLHDLPTGETLIEFKDK